MQMTSVRRKCNEHDSCIKQKKEFYVLSNYVSLRSEFRVMISVTISP